MEKTARGVARSAGEHPVVEHGARLGLAANGLLHLLIAWIALRVAWGGSSSEADQGGALATLAGTAAGSALLWTIAAGFALLALWQITEAFVVHDAKERVKLGAKAVVYLALVATTVSVVQTGSSSSSDGKTASLTADLLSAPLGRAAVVVVGLAIIALGVRHVVKGWGKGFLDDLVEHPGRAVVVLARVGYVTKGFALGVVGALLVTAGLTADPGRARGLDGALRALMEAPYGKGLLTGVALGLAAYGVYSFARARYARV
jgi:hypothetical protein